MFTITVRPSIRRFLGHVASVMLILATIAAVPFQPRVAGETKLPTADAKPSPRYSPEDVVRIQIRALSGEGDIKTRIERCYRFASPANRFHTGPPDRFATMLQAEPFAVLLEAKHFLVGRASQENGEALLLLTVVDRTGQLRLFRCFLSKQSNAQYDKCWMTDAVVPVGVANPPEQLRERESPAI